MCDLSTQVPGVAAVPRSQAFGRMYFKLQGHTGAVVGCKVLEAEQRLVSWGAQGTVIGEGAVTGRCQCRPGVPMQALLGVRDGQSTRAGRFYA